MYDYLKYDIIVIRRNKWFEFIEFVSSNSVYKKRVEKRAVII